MPADTWTTPGGDRPGQPHQDPGQRQGSRQISSTRRTRMSRSTPRFSSTCRERVEKESTLTVKSVAYSCWRSDPMVADWQLPPGVLAEACGITSATPLIARYVTIAPSPDSPLISWDPRLRSANISFASATTRRPRLRHRPADPVLPTAAGGVPSVLAVDLSEEMLAIVGEKALQADVHVDRLKANLVDLASLADGSFDAAACLFQTLGMIAGADARRKAIWHVHRLLRPGGRFVLHVHNRWFNAWTQSARPAAGPWRSVELRLLGPAAGRRLCDAAEPRSRVDAHAPVYAPRDSDAARGGRLYDPRDSTRRPQHGDGRLRCPWWLGPLQLLRLLDRGRQRRQPEIKVLESPGIDPAESLISGLGDVHWNSCRPPRQTGYCTNVHAGARTCADR